MDDSVLPASEDIAVAIDGNGVGRVAVLAPELTSPNVLAVRVHLAYEPVFAATAGLALEHSGRAARDVDVAARIQRDVQGLVVWLAARRRVATELSRPNDVPVGVVLSDEGVAPAGVGVSLEAGIGVAGNVYGAGTVERDAEYLVVTLMPELLCP